MPARTLHCAIEDLAKWHPQLYLEAHMAAFVAVTGQYSIPPAPFVVECHNVNSPWLKDESSFTLAMSWTEETVDCAERVRATMQPGPLVEFAAVATALVLASQVLALGPVDVTAHGDRADYRCPTTRNVLEVSGTENLKELGRRHRSKIKQAMENPFGWSAYVVVCAFADEGHRIRLSRHDLAEE